MGLNGSIITLPRITVQAPAFQFWKVLSIPGSSVSKVSMAVPGLLARTFSISTLSALQNMRCAGQHGRPSAPLQGVPIWTISGCAEPGVHAAPYSVVGYG